MTAQIHSSDLERACDDLARALARHQKIVARHARELPEPAEETLTALETSYFDLLAAASTIAGLRAEAAAEADLFAAKAA
jgi:hypothetical protein